MLQFYSKVVESIPSDGPLSPIVGSIRYGKCHIMVVSVLPRGCGHDNRD